MNISLCRNSFETSSCPTGVVLPKKVNFQSFGHHFFFVIVHKVKQSFLGIILFNVHIKFI